MGIGVAGVTHDPNGGVLSVVQDKKFMTESEIGCLVYDFEQDELMVQDPCVLAKPLCKVKIGTNSGFTFQITCLWLETYFIN